MPIASVSELAERLLQLHASKPDDLFYGTDVLGSLFRGPALDRLDAAYRELEAQQLMEQTRHEFTFFGVPKRFYQLTPKGRTLALEAPAA